MVVDQVLIYPTTITVMDQAFCQIFSDHTFRSRHYLSALIIVERVSHKDLSGQTLSKTDALNFIRTIPTSMLSFMSKIVHQTLSLTSKSFDPTFNIRVINIKLILSYLDWSQTILKTFGLYGDIFFFGDEVIAKKN